jgi:putative transposase
MRFEKKSMEGIDFNYDVTIVKDTLGRFSLHIPYHRENQPVQEPTSWCAVDPGVRTFATVFSPTSILKIGDGAATRLSRLLLCMDNLMSLRSATKGVQKKRRMGKAVSRMRLRIQNLTKELHCQAANCLTREFTDIVLPPFETQKMAARLGRKLTKKTTRNMLTLSHYKFRMRLQNTAVSRGCRVHILGEEYTSKTCTRCGTIKTNLGGAKEYKCSHCGLIIDRDVAGARNIFLKNISGP